MNFTLGNLDNVARQLGRGVLFQSAYWTGVADIALTYLGDTEGDIVLDPKSSISYLTATEVRGPAKLLGYEDGQDPTLSCSIWMGDPALKALISPTGSASMGRTRRSALTMYTLAVLPEEMFLDTGTLLHKVVAYTTAGGWTVNAIAMTAEQLRLLGHSIWLWRGHWMRPAMTLKHGDAGKSLESVQFQVMVDTTKPENYQLGTIGNPITAGILIDAA